MSLDDYDFMDDMSDEECQRFVDEKFREFQESEELREFSARFVDNVNENRSAWQSFCGSFRKRN